MATTLKQLLAEGSGALAAASDSARLDAELLLCHVLDISRAQLYANPEGLADADEIQEYANLLTARAEGRPLAHITGYKEFWSLPLTVNEHVLVPRPETELLVETALARIPLNGNLTILDLGTGSGAIPVALSTERTRCRFIATDISPAALAVARANATEHADVSIEFTESNWFEGLSGRRFNLITSNPPYVASDQPQLTDKALQFEPADALYSGADGLDAIRIIVARAPLHLEADGWLILEHGFDQAEAVTRLLQAAGFQAIRTHADIAGHPRVTEGQLTT